MRTFDFFTAIRYLRKGKKVRRRSWAEDVGCDDWCRMYGDILFYEGKKRAPREAEFIRVEHIFANDWEIVS